MVRVSEHGRREAGHEAANHGGERGIYKAGQSLKPTCKQGRNKRVQGAGGAVQVYPPDHQ